VIISAVLIISLSPRALAVTGELLLASAVDGRTPHAAGAFAASAPAEAAGNAPRCGKCHSACEEGINHAGHAPDGVARVGGLPLEADGVMGCATCHVSHGEGSEGVPGPRLRLSNLRRELCLACHAAGAEEGPRVEIVSPLERAIVREERLALIGRAARLEATDLSVRLNGSAFNLHVRDGHFFTWLTLQDGVNRIEIAQLDRVLWSGEVFHGVSGMDGYGRTATGHGTGSREECLGCHVNKDGMSVETTGAAPTLCYGCHDRFDGKRYVHGPLAVGDCLACHDPHGGLGAAHLRQEQGVLCRSCHTVRENAPKLACDASGKDCVACHEAHQSDARYLLKGPKYTLLEARPGRQ
jgi:predicted CXXCH cytochrome family protein